MTNNVVIQKMRANLFDNIVELTAVFVSEDVALVLKVFLCGAEGALLMLRFEGSDFVLWEGSLGRHRHL